MLLIARSIILAVLLTLAFIFAIILCLVRPMHRDNVHVIARIFSSVAPILGIKVIKRYATEESPKEPKIY